MSKSKKSDIESAAKSWGPIENKIDTKTLELWKRLDPDSQCQTTVEIQVGEESETDEAEISVEESDS